MVAGLEGKVCQHKEPGKKTTFLLWPSFGDHIASFLSHSICQSTHSPAQRDGNRLSLDEEWNVLKEYGGIEVRFLENAEPV